MKQPAVTSKNLRSTSVEYKNAIVMQAARDQGREGEELGVLKLRARQSMPSKHSVHRAKFRRITRAD